MANPEHRAGHFIGVDFGGTKISAGVFDARLAMVGSAKISTKPGRGPAAVMDRITRCVLDAVDECDLDRRQIVAVGVGAPGTVDTEDGRLIHAPNLRWKDVPLQRELARRLKVPVFVENDGSLCTLGVHAHELKGKPRHLLGIFLGTGIGGGLIVGGELYPGTGRTSVELGHMVVQAGGPRCGCGNDGCLEALASRAAIFRRLQAAVRDGHKTVLTEMLGRDLKDLRSADLRKAIRRGDKLVKALIEEAAMYTGIAVGSLYNLLSPDVIVLGGGLMEALEEEMLPVIQSVARGHTMPGIRDRLRIQASTLADHAGLVGGALLAQRRSGGTRGRPRVGSNTVRRSA